MRRRQKATIAAVTSVAVLTAGAGVGWVVTRQAGSSQTSGFCAEMPDAIGLYRGNPVTQMGYRVGHVDGVQPEGDHVRVSFTLDGNRRYPADVKALTRSKSLLADRSVELSGNYSAGAELTPGHCIPLSRSYTPKTISEITGSAADFIDAIAPDNGRTDLESAITGLDDALRGQGPAAQTLMLHAAAAMDSPDQLVGDVGTAIENMAPLSAQALQQWSSIRDIFDQLPSAVPEVSQLVVPVRQIAVAVGRLAAVLYDVQQHYGGDIWPLMFNGVAPLIDLAATRASDLRDLLSVIPPMAAALRFEAGGTGGLRLAYQPPVVRLPGSRATVTLLDLVLAEEK